MAGENTNPDEASKAAAATGVRPNPLSHFLHSLTGDHKKPDSIRFIGLPADSSMWTKTHSLDDLTITFKRTVRVSDNDGISMLPPDLGAFPIYDTKHYPGSLPSQKGYFLPMYQREAMWINFTSRSPYAIKIFLGGVNAVSGEPKKETESTLLHRMRLYANERPIQDYVVTTKQLWVDGIADHNGTVRQFVAMPLGAGYSVEAQITGAEAIGGLQIEVTPTHQPPPLRPVPLPPGKSGFQIFVKILTGKTLTLVVGSDSTIAQVKCLIEDKVGVPFNDQNLVSAGRPLKNSKTLLECNILKEATIHLTLPLRGGGGDEAERMGVAAGGHIKQTIKRDGSGAANWNGSRSTLVDVHIINSEVFKRITGLDPPSTPIDAQTYEKNGLPYYDVYDEEQSGIKGDFANVKSVNQLDRKRPRTQVSEAAIKEVEASTNNPVVELDGRGRRFRHVKELEEQLERALRISELSDELERLIEEQG